MFVEQVSESIGKRVIILPFVYRYTDLNDEIIKYVGITCRHSDTAVTDRANEHFITDEWFRLTDWKIEYLLCNTKTDANCLESHFISKYKTGKYFNVQKANHGESSFVTDEIEKKWIYGGVFFATQIPYYKRNSMPSSKKIICCDKKPEKTMKVCEVCEILGLNAQAFRIFAVNGKYEWVQVIKGKYKNEYIIDQEKFYKSDEYLKRKEFKNEFE